NAVTRDGDLRHRTQPIVIGDARIDGDFALLGFERELRRILALARGEQPRKDPEYVIGDRNRQRRLRGELIEHLRDREGRRAHRHTTAVEDARGLRVLRARPGGEEARVRGADEGPRTEPYADVGQA